MNSNILTQLLLALVAVGFFSDLAKGLFQKKKISSEANLDDANSVSVIVGSATELLIPLRARVTELEAEATLLRNELSQARGEVQRYSNQLEAASSRLELATEENQRITRENKQLRAMLAGGGNI
jgi:chromosome segregation ATPase